MKVWLGGDIAAWVNDLQRALPPGTPEHSVDAFVDTWCEVLFRQERLVSLMPLLSISLERNVSEGNLTEFKLALRDATERIAGILTRVCPTVRGAYVTDFLNTNLGLVAGLVPMARRTELHDKVLSAPELRYFAVEFEPQFRRSLLLMVRGMAEARPRGARPARSSAPGYFTSTE